MPHSNVTSTQLSHVWGGGVTLPGKKIQGSQWPSGLERSTSDQTVEGSSLTAENFSLRNFGNSVYPVFPVSFGGDSKSHRSLLNYLVSMPGEVKDPTSPHWNV